MFNVYLAQGRDPARADDLCRRRQRALDTDRVRGSSIGRALDQRVMVMVLSPSSRLSTEGALTRSCKRRAVSAPASGWCW